MCPSACRSSALRSITGRRSRSPAPALPSRPAWPSPSTWPCNSRPPILDEAGLMHFARKRFGQHFLHDPGVIQRIVAAVDPRPAQRVVEIGPGLGAITLPLLARLPELHAVEIDRDA